ncbi:receptor-like protein 12 isoform X1 [Arachis ipaensis]|nr:receptor-like protein 12 isoform X1 [Arachis ipaensis]XP_025656973.2 receptor-like protein EIX2 isoform X1 [Arachis hypogaea]
MMSNYFLKWDYALLVVLIMLYDAGLIHGEVTCLENERQALLRFKQSIDDPWGMLSTWRGDDCCKWQGITCRNQTGHVLRLHLRGSYSHHLSGQANISTLIDLQYLQHLDLSYNDFVNSYISEHIGLFSKLKYLNISDADFAGSIPYQLGNLSQLQYLDISDNDFGGEIPPQLGKLTYLQYMDLSYNYVDGVIPYQLKHLGQLQYLCLQGNSELSGAIPFQSGDLPLLQTLKLHGDFVLESKGAEWVSNLSFLNTLDLTSMSLGNSHQWLQMIRKHIPNLTELRLSDCSLSDNDVQFLFDIHSNYSSTTSLTILDFSDNLLTSSTFQLLSNFSANLRELYLSQNSIVLSQSHYPNFPSLVSLDLSYNNLTSLVFQGNFNLGSNLEMLDLSNCSLMDISFLVSSTSIVNSSSSLVRLHLSFNLLTSSNIFHWIFNFTANLHTLSLGYNLLEGPVPLGFDKAMKSLEYLDLSHNNLQGEIPHFFGNICTLQSLYLSYNNLSGDFSRFIQNSSWCNRHIFQELDLSYNRINGVIPKSIGLLSELEAMSLEGNSLKGEITESHLKGFSKLKYLFLSHNSISIKFFPGWIPPFQLISLSLASCKLGPNFPSWLHTQNYLSYLDISNAGIHGSVPEWFWYKVQFLEYYLNMSHNNFTGAIPNLSLRLPNGGSTDLSSNQFEGVIPSFLLYSSWLILSRNKFSNVSSLLCQENNIGSKLGTLDLSNNQLKGSLPDCWKSLSLLLFLDLSNNNLTGKIPPSMGSLVKLEALVLRSNGFIGKLPSSLKNCTTLFLLDVSENLLSGPIPSWIGESLHQLIVLSMSGNSFSGNLSKHLCYLKKIQLLDLSRNNLSNEIPTCLKNFTAMSKKSINSTETASLIYRYNNTYYYVLYGVYISRYTFNITVTWKGVKCGFKDPELRLSSIDLSSNHFTGEIPNEIVYLVGLVSLNLSRNNLSGEIPSEIGNITSLESLDLSRNHISGTIPSSLSQIDSLGVLELSNNSLYGRIPPGRHMDTFDASSFEGNPNLCGTQLNKTCPGDMPEVKPEEPTTHDDADDNSDFYEALHMSLGFGFFTGFWGLLGPLLFWRSWRIAYLRFLNKVADYIYVTVAVYVAKFHK